MGLGLIVYILPFSFLGLSLGVNASGVDSLKVQMQQEENCDTGKNANKHRSDECLGSLIFFPHVLWCWAPS